MAETPRGATLVDSRRIWDRAPHNAFTDLVRFRERWYCVFREGAAHVSPDGALRVLSSPDGLTWESAAVLRSERGDLRDAKITVTPDGQLMLGGASALHQPSPVRHQSYVWFSPDGARWSDPVAVGDPDMWLWRTTWHDGTAYAIGYGTAQQRLVRLYRSADGKQFTPLVPNLFDRDYPNEHSLVFLKDGTCLCLLRRDGAANSAQLGTARPPYTSWSWKDLGVRIGGPQAMLLPDGRIVAAVRLYDRAARTALCWLDPAAGRLTEFLPLVSGGDTSYPGLVWHDRRLWVSYYSSHTGKSCIYMARVALDPPDRT